MPNIKSMSSLRNYSDVLNEVDSGSPVFLTKNGKGKYAILDMEEYDSMRNALWGRLFEELDEAREAAGKQGWVPLADARKQVMDG